MNTMRLLKPLLTPAARHTLAARFAPVAIRAILDDAFDEYEAQRPDPREASTGGRMLVHLAALTKGLNRALLDRGVPEDEARSLTTSVTWRAYDKVLRAVTRHAASRGR